MVIIVAVMGSLFYLNEKSFETPVEALHKMAKQMSGVDSFTAKGELNGSEVQLRFDDPQAYFKLSEEWKQFPFYETIDILIKEELYTATRFKEDALVNCYRAFFDESVEINEADFCIRKRDGYLDSVSLKKDDFVMDISFNKYFQ